MSRPVLLVTPYFAPQTHAAMFRVHKLAKYLPQFGWTPIVLTTDTNYLYNENPALLDELPPEVEIHRARYVEPTMRGVRMALGGTDRTFAALKRLSHGPSKRVATNGTRATEQASPLLKRAYNRILKQAAQRPDPYWTWRRPAVRMARDLIREKGIDVIYTTTLPYSTLQIGETLQRTEGCRWVADFRDPGTYSQRMSSSVDRVYARQRRIERRALQRADAVTVLSSAYRYIFEDLYGPGLIDRIQFIPTGLDEALLPDPVDVQHGLLTFVGEYLEEYGDAFWRILRTALDSDALLRDVLQVKVIGHEGLNRPRIMPHLEHFGLTKFVSFIDHLPQPELYEWLARSQAGILIPGQNTHWWTNFAKMVDYIALHKPVLALLPNPSEARKELGRAGLGVFLDGAAGDAAKALIEFVNGKGDVARQKPTKDYLANEQVRAFARVLNNHC